MSTSVQRSHVVTGFVLLCSTCLHVAHGYRRKKRRIELWEEIGPGITVLLGIVIFGIFLPLVLLFIWRAYHDPLSPAVYRTILRKTRTWLGIPRTDTAAKFQAAMDDALLAGIPPSEVQRLHHQAESMGVLRNRRVTFDARGSSER